MSEFRDKDAALGNSLCGIDDALCGLHPDDKVEVYRTIVTRVGEAADRQAEVNERDGVPERPEAVRMDGELP